MFSLDHYSEFPQQHPCSSFNDETINPFHHQSYLPNQMGIFLPQIIHQDPISSLIPTNNDHHTNFPYNTNPQYESITYNHSTLGMSSPKKDRHTKISTADGFRDRRVRLSMAIAREFFDLQDMLGFDKASKTIGWLLAKSKNAIQDLALAQKGDGPRLSRSSSICCSSEEVFITKRRKKCPDANCSKEEVESQANSFAARENRAKARARARERTREKLIKPIQFDDLGFQTGCSSQLLTDFKAQELSRSSNLIEKNVFTAPLHNVGGSDVISRHSSSPSISCTDYLQNLLINTSPTDDQINASIRVNNHLPSLLFGGDYYPEANSSSFSGWNMHPHLYN